MQYVEIYHLENDGTQKVVVVCRLSDDNSVLCVGDEALVKRFSQEGIKDYSIKPSRRIFPKDGKIFLEQLKYNLTSGYLNASDVLK